MSINTIPLSEMTKEEILEAIDTMHEWGLLDPEGLPTKRSDVIQDAEEFWQCCVKYRQPFIDYVFRNLDGIIANVIVP